MASPVTPELLKLDVIKQNMEFALHEVFKELEIKSSQSHPDCPVLIDRAWIGMELMKILPHTAYLLKPEPHAMGSTELSVAMDDSFDAFRPPETLPPDPHDPTKPCYLLTLPRELRDMIFDNLISSGHPKILQTSKKLHDEGTELLYKRGICRINVNFTKIEIRDMIQGRARRVDWVTQTWGYEVADGCGLEVKFKETQQ